VHARVVNEIENQLLGQVQGPENTPFRPKQDKLGARISSSGLQNAAFESQNGLKLDYVNFSDNSCLHPNLSDLEAGSGAVYQPYALERKYRGQG
jgi:hypothetical protein